MKTCGTSISQNVPGKQAGARVFFNTTHTVSCCDGTPYLNQNPVKADLVVDAENVVVTRKTVILNGVPVDLVFAVFNKK